MSRDPIVEEIHEIRQKLIEEYGGFEGYVAHLFAEQEQMKDRVVSRKPRPPVAKNAASKNDEPSF